MINFVNTENIYTEVINAFINPILPHLDKFQITHSLQNNMVNVVFFTENDYFDSIKTNYTNGKTVFMTHGIADKNWRTAQKTDKFDYVCVTGDLWVNKLVKQGMNKSKIKVNGYTRMDDIYNQKDTYIKTNPNKRTILFAPTHTCSVTTYDKLNPVITALQGKYNILISEHPANRDNKNVTSTQYLEADVIVGDFGSSIYEAWSLGKPCVFADWLCRDDIHEFYPDSFEDYIYSESIDYHAKSQEEFIVLVDIAIKNGITMDAKRLIDGIFNKELRGCSGKVTANILKEIEEEL